jgi:hypothetical protein
MEKTTLSVFCVLYVILYRQKSLDFNGGSLAIHLKASMTAQSLGFTVGQQLALLKIWYRKNEYIKRALSLDKYK